MVVRDEFHGVIVSGYSARLCLHWIDVALGRVVFLVARTLVLACLLIPIVLYKCYLAGPRRPYVLVAPTPVAATASHFTSCRMGTTSSSVTQSSRSVLPLASSVAALSHHCVCGHRPKAYVENVYYPYGVEELQGKRNYMEDRHVEAGMVGRSSLRRVWPKRRPVTPWNDISWLWLSQVIPLRRSTPYLTGMAGRALQSA